MDKQIYRKFAKKALKDEAKFSAKCKHYGIISNIIKLIKITNSKKVLIFMPLSYEPNLQILRQKLSHKIEFFVPFMLDVSFKMVKFKRPFVKSKFGVKETLNQNEFKGKIDLAVVPVIGVDGNMARIGHGKGFYDMFFSALNYKPIIVFVSIKDNFTNSIISQKHDIIGDFYFTPSKNYFKKGKYDRYCSSISRGRSRCDNRLFYRQKD
ncbi:MULTISPECIES: 5-formyltetrahydrofolate cyclo-ligase [unclassified Campylobacter]|uniref:5-formyltetrahydrofolate cyclo-ligase n=1 Tax=unclassified Campylobacter TaxID=2593542 RepID=UPI0022E9F9CE|nr:MULTISPECIES: 5-formyltetrahydrofolate cyclo-ligase [unclassified Campylobacter]MDA3079061.1 5-formyltetrahydrofolate cyclo-ligase [Campylobacter sp. CS_NA2]MDA3080648.1 5-formyltetrahydrofolate cyclo-ligase [Campylobacter sp. CS_NA1]MDA3085147.1 5-formyltetrahydrofolate cyclo-ligase [Campylobacter sp. CS_ED1]MDA3089924.1 5-formyltetrahydrofolate cyclo-ligase [Campylobacter sp. CS_ED2]WBR51519.1 5-formyltetrahydrofolate cyclo-ligase [Campylobacter sp. CS_NA3]